MMHCSNKITKVTNLRFVKVQKQSSENMAENQRISVRNIYKLKLKSTKVEAWSTNDLMKG